MQDPFLGDCRSGEELKRWQRFGRILSTARLVSKILVTAASDSRLPFGLVHEWDIEQLRLSRNQVSGISAIGSAAIAGIDKGVEKLSGLVQSSGVNMKEVAQDTPIVLYCYKGVRSMTALKELKKEGFSNLQNLAGGIDRWALEVENSMPRY